MKTDKSKWLTSVYLTLFYVGKCAYADLCQNTINFSNLKCEYGRYIEDRCYRTFLYMTLYSCVRECLLRPNRCGSVNYLRLFQVCHICEGHLGSGRIVKKPGSVACNVVAAGLDNPFAECVTANCSWNERCIIDKSNLASCQFSECDIPEHPAPHGLGNKPIETKHGTRLRYQCPYYAADKPYVVWTCTDGGVWTGGQCNLTGSRNVSAFQSSTALNGIASLAVDGDYTSVFAKLSCSHTDATWDLSPWWEVRFPQILRISLVKIWNRAEDCCDDRLNNIRIVVINSSRSTELPCKSYVGPATNVKTLTLQCDEIVTGDIVRIEKNASAFPSIDPALSLCEVEVY